jgi:uncharacterized protein (TIGR03085 family)
MSSFVRSERAALAELFTEVGPDAPTLCEGWNTADLAAHLVSRERRPDAMPGIQLAFLQGYTEKVRLGTKTRPWPALIAAVASGPRLPNPIAVPAVDSAINSVEYFIHHEDVRRAQDGWEPRALSHEQQAALWRTLKIAPVLLRSARTGVLLVAPGHGEIRGHKGEPPVTLTGEPAELLLFCNGRQKHARVEFDGDPAATADLCSASFGV